MNTTLLLILTPLITAGIGWLTNWVAIQMLFHPRVPMRVFFWKWQGLTPAASNSSPQSPRKSSSVKSSSST